jgi:glucose/arabinose dehydrogenase
MSVSHPFTYLQSVLLAGVVLLGACTVGPAATPTDTPAAASAAETAPTPSPVTTNAAADDLAAPIPAIDLTLLAEGFSLPLYLTHANDGSNRLFVVEKDGIVRIIQNGAVQDVPFMDIDSLVGSNRNEQGLLSIAFHPDFANTGRLFVNYTDNSGDTVVAGYDVTADGQLVDLATAQVILTIPQPHANHNGGQLQFGPDGYLYIGTGDGGSANDPYSNGQNPAALLGKMLRIAVDGEPPYQIPADNPFLDQADFLPEIWSLGLRNPWRFSFDRSTGDLYIADVGQNQYEEVNLQPAGQGGLNYGWSIMEGAHCFQSGQCDSAGLTQPLAEYDHGQGCSVTGGHVYRGAQFPALAGVYLYGDFCSGKIWGVRPGGQAVELLDTDMSISSFGEDETGELYVMDYRGSVYQIRAN